MVRFASRRSISLLFAVLALLTLTPSTALTARSPNVRAPAAAPAQLAPGSTAVVKADGDCLRIREKPALTSKQLTCLPEGASVQILDGTQTADGYTWRKVQTGSIVGWGAEQYLQPASVTPGGGACPATSIAASSTTQPAAGRSGAGFGGGEVPSTGGYGLVVWGGGTAEAMATTAAAGGCDLTSVWATNPGGELIVFIFGAPDVVNQAWTDEFSKEGVPAGTGVLLVCGGATASAVSTSTQGAGGPAASAAVAPETAGVAATMTAGAPAVAAKAAIVIDGPTGTVLSEQEAHAALPPASLTKMVTAILAIEQGDLDAWVKTDVDSRAMPGSSLMGLLPGDCFQLRDLVYGLMLPSGNDAAIAIARHIAGSEAAFVEQMNAFLVRLGLKDSKFANAHGLDASAHRASAYDLAMTARYGMTLPSFEQVVRAPQWTAKGSRTINLPNVNGFLASYAGADGVKTGFTEGAGRTLVASAMKGGRRVYVVLLNDDARYEDAAKLMDWAFQRAN